MSIRSVFFRRTATRMVGNVLPRNYSTKWELSTKLLRMNIQLDDLKEEIKRVREEADRLSKEVTKQRRSDQMTMRLLEDTESKRKI